MLVFGGQRGTTVYPSYTPSTGGIDFLCGRNHIWNSSWNLTHPLIKFTKVPLSFSKIQDPSILCKGPPGEWHQEEVGLTTPAAFKDLIVAEISVIHPGIAM